MRKIVIALTLFLSIISYSQTNSINYKAIVKDNLGNVISNQTITVQIGILQGLAQTNVYTETHAPTTDANGIVVLNIGLGTPVSGTYGDINWASDDHYLNVQIDSGSGLVDLGTTQFMAVPYALSSADNNWDKAPTHIYNSSDPVAIGLSDQPDGQLEIESNSGVATPQLTLSEAEDDYARLNYKTTNGSSYWTLAGLTQPDVEDDRFNVYNSRYGNVIMMKGNGRVGIGADPSSDFHVGFGKSVLFGNSLSGSGTKLMWLPDKAAFRAGFLTGGFFSDRWDDANVGYNSFAANSNNFASGAYTTAFGTATEATGEIATVFGLRTLANAYNSFSIGRYNIGGGDPISWIETDPLFEIGNGSDGSNRSNALTILKNGTVIAPSLDIGEITDDKTLVTKEYVDTNSSISTGLEALNEGNGIGWRLIGRNPDNLGDIGLNAIDFSNWTLPSTTNGATGDYAMAVGNRSSAEGNYSFAMGNIASAQGDLSFAFGQNTIARSLSEVVVGSYNENYAPGTNGATQWNEIDRLFVIGNGPTFDNRSNALIVLKNGTITAPSFDIGEITDDKALVTKEYLEANVDTSTGLETLDEGNGFGWRLKNQDPNNYGDIGLNAMDLSAQINPSTTTGATGNYSTAMGLGTEASSIGSTSMGLNTLASGVGSTALGDRTEATGFNSTALGENTIASNRASIAMGRSTEASGESSTSMGEGTEASASWSTAMGLNTVASGISSTAMGNTTNAIGTSSIAMGLGTNAGAIYTTAIGRYNIGGGNGTTWVDTDPLFEVGNGTSGASRDNALTILKNGNIGIGRHTPSSLLEIAHGSSAPTPGNVSNALSIYNTGNANSWQLYSSSGGGLVLYRNGAFRGGFDGTSGVYNSVSDRRVKSDIQSLEQGTLDKVMQLNPVSYRMKAQSGNERTIGLISQEVEQVFPEVTDYVKEHDLLTLSYSELIPVLIKAIQEQQTTIERLNQRITQLEKK
ncbi:tail fiber domain-containing protein [Winogradskyella sp. 3972H.M.0a.05]|uniref:tail fiber domain-containing protein n=1 Tax=Winogradskyella sp. 3972H.M.0a.05 TaxID=2950277 RepID=UPI0033912CC9